MTSIVISPMRVLLGAALALLIGLFAPVAAFAADAAHGAQIFSANCAACHIGGGNVVNAQRTLKQADLDAYLDKYGNGHETAIAYQVTNGKNAMPAFGGKLSDTDIADVAAYVEQQAGNGWS
jgi:cytochrome c6